MATVAIPTSVADAMTPEQRAAALTGPCAYGVPVTMTDGGTEYYVYDDTALVAPSGVSGMRHSGEDGWSDFWTTLAPTVEP